MNRKSLESSLNSLVTTNNNYPIALNSHSGTQLFASKVRKSQSYLVQIPVKEQQRQCEIYSWRLSKIRNVLGLIDFTVIHQSDRKMLARVQLEPYQCPLQELEQLTLTQCLKYFREVLNGMKVLTQWFVIKHIEAHNIFLCQNDQIKIWPCKIQLNPELVSYPQSSYRSNEIQVCQDLIRIMKQKCLKTKLSHSFFNRVQSLDSFEDLQRFVEAPGLFNLRRNSQSLEFSNSLLHKKRVKQLQRTKSMPFMNLQDSQNVVSSCSCINNRLSNSKKDQQSASTKKSDTTHFSDRSKVGKISRFRQDSQQDPNSQWQCSLTTSCIYNDTREQNTEESAEPDKRKSFNEELTKHRNRQPWFNECDQPSLLQVPRAQKRMQIGTQQECQPFDIIGRNGWSAEMRSLFQSKNIQQSINIKQSKTLVKQQSNVCHQRALNKLAKLGRQAHESFYLVEQEQRISRL